MNDKVLGEAQQKFATEAASHFFTGTRVNRFQVQQLTDGSITLVLGSAGTVNGAPVARVVGSFNVDPEWAKDLARAINETIP